MACLSNGQLDTAMGVCDLEGTLMLSEQEVEAIRTDWLVGWNPRKESIQQWSQHDRVMKAVPALIEDWRRMRETLKKARAAMKRHDDAPYQCESTQGAAGSNDCVEILDAVLAAITPGTEQPARGNDG